MNKIITNYKQYDCLENELITILGLPFKDINKNYSRIMGSYIGKFDSVNPKLNSLGKCTAGASMTFKTNSTSLVIKYQLDRKPHHYHMTNVNEIGFDMYISVNGKLRLINITNLQDARTEQEVVLFENFNDDEKEVLINFPLYAGVDNVKLLIDDNAKIIKYSRFDSGKRWLFYGTSITQGGCSSRSGMCYTNILSRHYKKEIINLGFSGNGLGEVCMAEMISEIDNLEMVFIDYDANAVLANVVNKTLELFIDILRSKKPNLKIVIISRVRTIDGWRNNTTALFEDARMYERDLVNSKNSQGDKDIYFIDGLELFSEDDFDEYTVDGVHFTDLGYMEYCKGIIPFIDKIVK